MDRRVAVVGIGHAGFAPIVAGLSYKELMFEAAQRSYFDAGVDPRTEIDSFVCCSEDFLEGTSIFDEYVPDQIGAVKEIFAGLKVPVYAVPGNHDYYAETDAIVPSELPHETVVVRSLVVPSV